MRGASDPVAEAIRFQIAEAEIVQCIGRGRAINRTADDPLAIEIWANVVLPVTVNEVAPWTAVSTALTDPAIEMLAAGVILELPTDMAAIWPDRWGNADVARKALGRAPARDQADISL